jgi:competence protein ComEA
MPQETTPGKRPSATESRRSGLMLLAAVLTIAMTFSLASRAGVQQQVTPIRLRIDPNTAPQGALEALPRIGPALARRIIEAREDSPILDTDDLDRRIRGVGPATIDAMRPYLRFGDGKR